MTLPRFSQIFDIIKNNSASLRLLKKSQITQSFRDYTQNFDRTKFTCPWTTILRRKKKELKHLLSLFEGSQPLPRLLESCKSSTFAAHFRKHDMLETPCTRTICLASPSYSLPATFLHSSIKRGSPSSCLHRLWGLGYSQVSNNPV